MEEAENLFDVAIQEHSRVVKHVLETQSKVKQVLSKRSNLSVKDSALIAAVVVEMVEEEVKKE
jgi:hypothetical protein